MAFLIFNIEYFKGKNLFFGKIEAVDLVGGANGIIDSNGDTINTMIAIYCMLFGQGKQILRKGNSIYKFV